MERERCICKKYIETIDLSTYSFNMKKKKRADREDVEAIRDQLLDFACAKHDFKLTEEKYLPGGDWKGTFMVKFRDNPVGDRLHCSIPFGEQFITFGLDLAVEDEIWKSTGENILRVTSRYDIAVYVSPEEEKDCMRRCRLSARAWIPNFGQRIFGLTFSNLMGCKEAVLQMLSER